MPIARILAAALGLSLPLALAAGVTAGAQAAPHKLHPAAHVRTATYKVAAPAKHHHRLRAARPAHDHLAQAHRHRAIRRS